MTKNDRQKWLDALRSGEYEQTVDVLRDDTGFCSLGVAVDQLAPDMWLQTKWYGWIADGYTAALSDRLLERLGIDQVEAALLTVRNDDDRWTFPQIADYIEKHIQPTDDPKDAHATD